MSAQAHDTGAQLHGETKAKGDQDDAKSKMYKQIGLGLLVLAVLGGLAYLVYYLSTESSGDEAKEEEDGEIAPDKDEDKAGTGTSTQTRLVSEPYTFAWNPERKGSGLELAQDDQEVVATEAHLALVLADRGFAVPLASTAGPQPEFSLKIESSSPADTPKLIFGFCLDTVDLSVGSLQAGLYDWRVDNGQTHFNNVANTASEAIAERPKVGDVVKARYTGTAIEFYSTGATGEEKLVLSRPVVLPPGTYYAFCGHGSSGASSFAVLHV